MQVQPSGKHGRFRGCSNHHSPRGSKRTSGQPARRAARRTRRRNPAWFPLVRLCIPRALGGHDPRLGYVPGKFARVAVAYARVQNIHLRSGARIFGKQGGIHDIDVFRPFDGGRARGSGKCLLIEQLACFGNRRNPWHWRSAQPRGNNSRWRTIGNGWSEWHRGSARPGWNDRKRWNRTTRNGWSEWYWRAHRLGNWWRGHGWSLGLGRRRGWGRSNRHRRHAARRLGR